MGTTLEALIECDRSRLFEGSESSAPFAGPTDDVLSFIDYTALSHGKDYTFVAAISGRRNESGVEPLFPLRGLPPNPSVVAQRFLDPSSEFTGWLTFREIQAALAHTGISEARLSLAVRVVMTAMRLLAAELGDDRVRLVFEVS